MRNNLFLIAALLVIAVPAWGQGKNITLLGNLNEYIHGYSDCWGYTSPGGTEYALLCTKVGASIIDITADPVEVDHVPWVFSTWYDVKTYQNTMYVVTEANTSMQIVDLTPLPGPVVLVDTVVPFSTAPHNLWVDEARALLYGIEDGKTTPAPVRIFSLADPHAPAQLSTLGGICPESHDVFTQGNRLYVAEGGAGTVGVFDVTDPASPFLLQRIPVPDAGYVHNVWVSGDGNTMVTTEETRDKTVKFWDISDLANATLVDDYLGPSEIAHNAFLHDGYAILSHYWSGLRIIDVSNPGMVVEVGSLDTYPQIDGSLFRGAWGTYPFFASGKILISDVTTGLYVAQFNGARAGIVQGTVTDAGTSLPLAGIDLRFREAGVTVRTDGSGQYSLPTFEGLHTIEFDERGFVAGTSAATVLPGSTVTHDLALQPNPVEIEVSTDPIVVTLPSGSETTTLLNVENVGSGGVLTFRVDDLDAVSKAPILVDPAGDVPFGTGGDVVEVTANSAGSDLVLDVRLNGQVQTDSLVVVLGLDTDFNPDTGASPGGAGLLDPAQEMGTEYDVIIDIPGNVLDGTPHTVYLFTGANALGGGTRIRTTTAVVMANVVSFALSFEDVQDDGVLAIAGRAQHLLLPAPASADLFPDAGHGALGVDPTIPWLSVTPPLGNLTAGQSQDLQLRFDATGLASGNYVGTLSISSNDLDEPKIPILLAMTVTEPTAAQELPTPVALGQNTPNPFNPATTIEFVTETEGRARLIVFSSTGRLVRVLSDGHLPAGRHRLRWDGRDRFGQPVASGTYLYRLEAGDIPITRKMVLVR